MRINEKFSCPICSQEIGPYSRGITFHARVHKLTAEEFWCIVNAVKDTPKCKCKEGCTALVKWKSWEVGYTLYAKGHYDLEKRSSASRESLLKSHWARGKTKENDERIRASSCKQSTTLKKRYANSEIKHWAKGKAASNDPIITMIISKRAGKTSRNQHHNWCDEVDLQARILESASNKFNVTAPDSTPLTRDFLESRVSNTRTRVLVECLRCNNKFARSIYGVVRSKLRCESCDRTYTSKSEEEIYEFVSSLLTEKVQRRRLGPWGEIDIYVPSKKFGIEFNGLYWHSEAVQEDKNYHQKKSDMAAEHGITLLHIFEDDWLQCRKIVESIIKHRLYLSTRIGARKCNVVELTSGQKSKFFTDNHIDGDAKSSSTFGLIYNDEIVAAASFRRPFHKKWSDYVELARFCTKNDVNVPGGLSRLVKHFIKKNKKPILSYQDSRLGGSKSYEVAGFKLVGETSPTFWWTDTTKRYNRFSLKATNGLAESKVSLLKRKLKIWGNKNYVWVYAPLENVDITL